MTTLRVSLHPAQQLIHDSPARFKVVVAGRRFGKTVYAVILCLLEGLRSESRTGKRLGTDAEVIFVGVDREQAKRNAWNLFKELGDPVIARTPGGRRIISEKDYVITLVNGVRVRLMGMDDGGESIRGMKLRFAVLDEYADMPSEGWGAIIRPALMDTGGGALFIGTPKGKNHFHEMYLNALTKPTTEDGFSPFHDWEAFNFSSRENTTLDESELKAIAVEFSNGSTSLLRQEIEAQFISKGGDVFEADWFRRRPEPRDGAFYITVDPSGFAKDGQKTNAEIRRLDDTAITINKVHSQGWWVKEIQYGKWGVRETAYRIVKAAYDNEALTVGIEKGALLNAMQHYLSHYQMKYGRPLHIVPLTHGNKAKWDRITWALQGRAEKGTISLNEAEGENPWQDKLIDQACDFPDRRTKDDLLDSLAYQDQVAKGHGATLNPVLFAEIRYEPLDEISGY